MRKIFVGVAVVGSLALLVWAAVHIVRFPRAYDARTNTRVYVTEEPHVITVDVHSNFPVRASRWVYADESHAGFDLEICCAGKWHFSASDLPLQDRPVAFRGVVLEVTQPSADGTLFIDGYGPSRQQYVLVEGDPIVGRAHRLPFRGTQTWNPDGLVTFTEEETGTVWRHMKW